MSWQEPKVDWAAGDIPGPGDFNRIETNMQLITPLGVPIPYFFNFLPAARYLWCDGRTIGDELSGATARANADTFDLFEGLWISMDNTVLPIQNSDGTAGTRGISALDDFNAHKRLPIPDLRGRTLIGLDNMGGISAGRVTATQADTLGGTGGVENQSLTGDQNGPHTHVLSTNWSSGTGSYPHANWGSRNGEYDPTTLSTQSSGSGTPHNNMQPYMAVNYIIRY
jgi:microcystin-dependent protein